MSSVHYSRNTPLASTSRIASPPAPADLAGSGSASAASSADASGLVTQVYKAALGSFINKQFAEATETLEPVLKTASLKTGDLAVPAWTRLWKLQLALLVRAAEQIAEETAGDSEPANGNEQRQISMLSSSAILQTWTPAKRTELATKLYQNIVWEEVIESADGLHNVPPQLLTTLMTASLQYSHDVTHVARTVETYIVSNPAVGAADPDFEDPALMTAFHRVLEIYAGELLPHEGEFELASELINLSSVYPEHLKPALLAKIAEEKTLKAEREKAQKEAEIKQELARKEQARKERDQREKAEAAKAAAEKERAAAAAAQRASLAKATPDSSFTAASNASKEANSLQPTARSSTWNSLRRHWGASLSKALNYSTLVKYVFPFFFLLFVLSRPVVRQKLRALFAALWVKLAQTFSMGMKVSYV